MATEDYFSIDDILSAEPRLYCTFRVRGHNLGHLDPIGVQAAVLSNPPPNDTIASSSSSAPSRRRISSSTPNTSSTPLSSSNATPSTQSQDEQNGEAEEDEEEDEEDPTLHIPMNHRLALPFWLAETLAQRSLITLHLPHCFKPTIRHALRADAPSVNLQKLCSSYYALGIRVAQLVKDITLPSVLGRAFANRCWQIVDHAAYASNKGSKALIKLDRMERKLFFAAHKITKSVLEWKERKGDRIVAFQPLLGKRSRSSMEGDKAEEDTTGSPITTPNTSRVRVC